GMALALDDRKLLPHGIDEASLAEVEEHFARFQKSDRRIKLFRTLRDFLTAVKKAGCGTGVILNGSFMMACADEPCAIDLILVLPQPPAVQGIGVGEVGLPREPVLDHARRLGLAAGAIEQHRQGVPAIGMVGRPLQALQVVLLGPDRIAEPIAALAEIVAEGRVFGLELKREGEALAGVRIVALLE